MTGLIQGWYPAIMNSQNELDYVRFAQRLLLNRTSYYIGGSTNAAAFASIGLSAYSTDSPGYIYEQISILN